MANWRNSTPFSAEVNSRCGMELWCDALERRHMRMRSKEDDFDNALSRNAAAICDCVKTRCGGRIEEEFLHDGGFHSLIPLMRNLKFGELRNQSCPGFDFPMQLCSERIVPTMNE